jgi:hypothetical protein
MIRLGRATPSAGRDVIDRKACFLSLVAQAAVRLLELRVFQTFPDNLPSICSGHGYLTRRATSSVDPDDPPRLCSTFEGPGKPQGDLLLQRWIGAPDFPSEWAGTGLTSLKRERWTLENAYHSMPFARASGLLQATFPASFAFSTPIDLAL